MQVVPAFVPTVPNVSPRTRGRVGAVDKANTVCVPGVPTFFRYLLSIQTFSSCGAPTPPRAQRRSSYGEEMPLTYGEAIPLKVGDIGDRGVLDMNIGMNKLDFRPHLSPAKRGHAGYTLSSLGDTQDRDSRRRSIICCDRILFVAPRTLEGKILEETANRVPAGGFSL